MTLSFSNFAHVLVAVVVVLRSTDVHLAPLLLIIFLPTICSFLYTVEYSIFITSDLAFSVVIFTNHIPLVSCKSDWLAQCSGFVLQWPLLHLPFYWMARWHSYFYIHVSRGKIILCYNKIITVARQYMCICTCTFFSLFTFQQQLLEVEREEFVQTGQT